MGVANQAKGLQEPQWVLALVQTAHGEHHRSATETQARSRIRAVGGPEPPQVDAHVRDVHRWQRDARRSQLGREVAADADHRRGPGERRLGQPADARVLEVAHVTAVRGDHPRPAQEPPAGRRDGAGREEVVGVDHVDRAGSGERAAGRAPRTWPACGAAPWALLAMTTRSTSCPARSSASHIDSTNAP